MPVNVPVDVSNEDQEITELAEFLQEMVEKLGDDDPGTILLKTKEGQEVTEIAPEKAGAKSLEQLAQVVYQVAEHEAIKIGGATYFVTMKGVSGRFPLVFQGVESEEEEERSGGMMRYEGGGGISRLPGRTPVEGWVQHSKQIIDHNEVLFKATITERAEIFKLFKSVIQEQNETIRSLEKERAKERVLIEELQSAKHMRDMEMSRMVKAEERKEEALGLVKPWAHAISARLLGPAAVPKEMTPLLDQFDAVFSTFTQEQFMELTTSGKLELTPRQRQEITGLFSTLMNLTEQAKKAKEAKEKAATPNGSS